MNDQTLKSYLTSASDLIHQTIARDFQNQMNDAVDAIVKSFQNGGTLMVCGNGGSAADASHITAELVGRFYKMERPALRCINLAADASVLTAWPNDYAYDTVFARQVEAYGTAGSVLWGLSTSGNSKNVVAAFEAARKLGITTIAMTGDGGGQLKQLADYCFDVPSAITPEIQQIHICFYHYMCGEIERKLFT